jgi:hypothetical protein
LQHELLVPPKVVCLGLCETLGNGLAILRKDKPFLLMSCHCSSFHSLEQQLTPISLPRKIVAPDL